MKIRIVILAAFCLLCGACQKQPTDYETELAGIDRNIAQIESDFDAGRIDRNKIIKRVYYLYSRASLSGDFEDFKKAELAIDNALEMLGPVEALQLFKMNFDFKLHRLAAAKAELEALAETSEHPEIKVLRADIALQEGDYPQAQEAYEKLTAGENPRWDNLARLAYYKAKTGHPEEADKLYVEAQEKLSVKQMRSFAWLEMQRGLVDLDYKRYREALEHYKRANRAYSGYWLIEEHTAEVMNLLGKTTEAATLYRNIIEKTHNPEFISALAAIVRSSDAAAAGSLYQQADELFEKRYQLFPEAAAGHFVKYLLLREGNDPRLLAYAERNHAVRPNAEAKFLLLQAYQKTDNESAARDLMRKILQTPWRRPDIESVAKQMKLL
jgi:tetratricopeptide (TPR) repeat protein